MREKSVREMSGAERLRHSLGSRVFRSELCAFLILGLVAYLAGMGFYTVALINQYVGEAFGLARSGAAIITDALDPVPMSEELLRVYHSLSDEERAQTGTPEYRTIFAEFAQNEDNQQLRRILRGLGDSSNVDYIYLGMYDRETNALVYILDPYDDEEGSFAPGEWEGVSESEVNHWFAWNGEGMLYLIGNPEEYGWMGTAAYPIRNAEGEIALFVLSDVMLDSVIEGMKTFTIRFTAAILITTALALYFLTRYMKKSVVAPINEIADAANSYIADKKNGAEETSHFDRLNIKTGDEIENLGLVMANMETEIADYIENLTTVTAEKERIGAELDMATRIQANMLPNIFPAFPKRSEFDLYATMQPAKEVGGDFYDFFLIDSDHLALVMADVSGKGVPAALFMMTSRTLIKDAALEGLDPSSVMFRVNERLNENNKDSLFVTVWLGILTISTGELTYSDAGHEKLLLYQQGEWRFLPKGGCTALAVLEPDEFEDLPDSYRYRNETIRLRSGDMIFQYTDGVTEATNARDELFGDDRLMRAMQDADDLDPEKLLPHVRGRIDEFVKDAPQFDDITMLGMRYLGKSE